MTFKNLLMTVLQKNGHETFAPDEKRKTVKRFQQFGPFQRRRSQLYKMNEIVLPYCR